MLGEVTQCEGIIIVWPRSRLIITIGELRAGRHLPRLDPLPLHSHASLQPVALPPTTDRFMCVVCVIRNVFPNYFGLKESYKMHVQYVLKLKFDW